MKPFEGAISLLVIFTASILSCPAATSSNAYAPRSAVSAGQRAPMFRATTVEGKSINFPADYRGKVVLLDFWATWCPPCRDSIPRVVAAYNQLHEQGFEILGVSLDHPKKGPELLQFTKDNNMPWAEIYDGQSWKGPIVSQYGVHAIPCPVLVDGDTGIIIATDVGAFGTRLTRAVQTRLAARAKAATDEKSGK
jgi:peroxiredoxin